MGYLILSFLTMVHSSLLVFGSTLHHLLGTKLVRSSAYHPQTSGQTERVNQILEDMLLACVISSKGSWEKWLPLAEFSYNNGYQESIKMAPFEALYFVQSLCMVTDTLVRGMSEAFEVSRVCLSFLAFYPSFLLGFDL
jgi:hypothetical protein